MNNILLSICIPTYNRVDNLKKCLDSIISQEEFFSGNVEIVISDNASTDNTMELCLNYKSKYENIIYHRNDKNVTMENFPIVFSLATGELAKIINDTAVFKEGSLREMLALIKDNIDAKPVLFFLTSKNENKHFTNLDDFLYNVSFNTTWIACLSLWKEDRVGIRNNLQDCDTYLWQVPVLLDSIIKHQNSIICSFSFFSIKNVDAEERAHAYISSLHTIFYKNYISILQRYVNKKCLSKDCFEWLEKDLLFNFFVNWIVLNDISKEKKYRKGAGELKESIKVSYSDRSYYNEYVKYYNSKKMMMKITKILKKIFIVKWLLKYRKKY